MAVLRSVLVQKPCGLMTSKWYDQENNFRPLMDDDCVALTKVNRLRLLVAAEFMRCKVYGAGGIDSALDDADTVIGFLFREGYLDE